MKNVQLRLKKFLFLTTSVFSCKGQNPAYLEPSQTLKLEIELFMKTVNGFQLIAPS